VYREADVAVLRWCYKHCREIARRMKSYRGCLPSQHPKFPEGSEAAKGMGRCDGPDDMSSPPIKYTEEDLKAIDHWHRESGMSDDPFRVKFILIIPTPPVETSWHSVRPSLG